MLESSSICLAHDYSNIVHLLKETTSLAPQLKYINYIVLELKVKLTKTITEVKEIKKALICNPSFFDQPNQT